MMLLEQPENRQRTACKRHRGAEPVNRGGDPTKTAADSGCLRVKRRLRLSTSGAKSIDLTRLGSTFEPIRARTQGATARLALPSSIWHAAWINRIRVLVLPWKAFSRFVSSCLYLLFTTATLEPTVSSVGRPFVTKPLTIHNILIHTNSSTIFPNT